MLEAGNIIRDPNWAERLYRRRDIAQTLNKKVQMCHAEPSYFKCRDRFRVVVVTSLEKSQLSDSLFNGFVGLPDNANFELLTVAT